MTTEIFVTNHPETVIVLDKEKISSKQASSLAEWYVSLVNIREQHNKGILTMMIRGVKDNPTFTSVATNNQILLRDKIIPGRDQFDRPLRLRNGESLIIFRKGIINSELTPYITVRRLNK